MWYCMINQTLSSVFLFGNFINLLRTCTWDFDHPHYFETKSPDTQCLEPIPHQLQKCLPRRTIGAHCKKPSPKKRIFFEKVMVFCVITLPASWMRPVKWNQSSFGKSFRMRSAVWNAWTMFGMSTSGSLSSTNSFNWFRASFIVDLKVLKLHHFSCFSRKTKMY